MKTKFYLSLLPVMLLFYLINPLNGNESIRYGSITVQQMERIDTLGESYLTIRGAGTTSFLSQDQSPLYILNNAYLLFF